MVGTLVIADLTRGTGRFNLMQGALATATGIGASSSNLMTGFVVKARGYDTGFLVLAAIAAAAFVFYGLAMPETWTHPRESILATGPAHVVEGPDRIRVRTWAEATVKMVRSRVDGGPWTTLEVDELVGSCWSAPLHGDRLARGEHTLEVEVCDEEDCVGLRAIRFVVDPTGCYTPVPRVEPWVAETAFC